MNSTMLPRVSRHRATPVFPTTPVLTNIRLSGQPLRDGPTNRSRRELPGVVPTLSGVPHTLPKPKPEEISRARELAEPFAPFEPVSATAVDPTRPDSDDNMAHAAGGDGSEQPLPHDGSHAMPTDGTSMASSSPGLGGAGASAGFGAAPIGISTGIGSGYGHPGAISKKGQLHSKMRKFGTCSDENTPVIVPPLIANENARIAAPAIPDSVGVAGAADTATTLNGTAVATNSTEPVSAPAPIVEHVGSFADATGYASVEPENEYFLGACETQFFPSDRPLEKEITRRAKRDSDLNMGDRTVWEALKKVPESKRMRQLLSHDYPEIEEIRNLLDSPDRNLTFLVPTDTALKEGTAWLNRMFPMAVTPDIARDTVLLHILPTTRLNQDNLNPGDYEIVETALTNPDIVTGEKGQGQRLAIYRTPNKMTQVFWGVFHAPMTTANLSVRSFRCKNGVILLVDKVMWPPRSLASTLRITGNSALANFPPVSVFAEALPSFTIMVPPPAAIHHALRRAWITPAPEHSAEGRTVHAMSEASDAIRSITRRLSSEELARPPTTADVRGSCESWTCCGDVPSEAELCESCRRIVQATAGPHRALRMYAAMLGIQAFPIQVDCAQFARTIRAKLIAKRNKAINECKTMTDEEYFNKIKNDCLANQDRRENCTRRITDFASRYGITLHGPNVDCEQFARKLMEMRRCACRRLELSERIRETGTTPEHAMNRARPGGDRTGAVLPNDLLSPRYPEIRYPRRIVPFAADDESSGMPPNFDPNDPDSYPRLSEIPPDSAVDEFIPPLDEIVRMIREHTNATCNVAEDMASDLNMTLPANARNNPDAAAPLLRARMRELTLREFAEARALARRGEELRAARARSSNAGAGTQPRARYSNTRGPAPRTRSVRTNQYMYYAQPARGAYRAQPPRPMRSGPVPVRRTPAQPVSPIPPTPAPAHSTDAADACAERFMSAIGDCCSCITNPFERLRNANETVFTHERFKNMCLKIRDFSHGDEAEAARELANLFGLNVHKPDFDCDKFADKMMEEKKKLIARLEANNIHTIGELLPNPRALADHCERFVANTTPMRRNIIEYLSRYGIFAREPIINCNEFAERVSALWNTLLPPEVRARRIETLSHPDDSYSDSDYPSRSMDVFGPESDGSDNRLRLRFVDMGHDEKMKLAKEVSDMMARHIIPHRIVTPRDLETQSVIRCGLGNVMPITTKEKVTLYKDPKSGKMLTRARKAYYIGGARVRQMAVVRNGIAIFLDRFTQCGCDMPVDRDHSHH